MEKFLQYALCFSITYREMVVISGHYMCFWHYGAIYIYTYIYVYLLHSVCASYRGCIMKSFQEFVRAYSREPTNLFRLQTRSTQDSAYGEHRGISFISWHRSSIQWEVFREHRLHVRYILVWIYSHAVLYTCNILIPSFRSRAQVTLDKKIDIFPRLLYDKRFYIILRKRRRIELVCVICNSTEDTNLSLLRFSIIPNVIYKCFLSL